MSAQRNILRTVFVPALATVVVGGWAGAGLYVPTDTAGAGIATRSPAVALLASIDTDPDALGISESSLYFMDQSDLNTAMDELQTMGVTQIRVLLPWGYMEPTEGTYSWTQSDQLLDTAAKYNIAVDAVVVSSPPWASQYSAGGLIADARPDPSAYDDYAGFLADLATRYTSKISSIEVWNEPNGYNGWYPTPDPDAYTALLKEAYTAIKSADPNITVVGGVLGAGKTIGSLTINPVDFLQQMYADGASGYFDALSFHPYNYTSTFSQGTLFPDSAIKQLQAMRDLMNANGDAAKMIWATEYGEPSTTSGGEAQQAAYIQDFLSTWSSLTGVGPMFLYNLIDSDTGSSTPEDNLGLFTDDWTAKTALTVVEAWLAAHPTDEATDPPADAPADPPAATLVNAVAAAAQAMMADAGKMMATAVGTVQHMISGVATALVNLVNALATTVRSAATAVVDTVSRTAQSIAATVTPKAVSVSPAVAGTAASATALPATTATDAATAVTARAVAKTTVAKQDSNTESVVDPAGKTVAPVKPVITPVRATDASDGTAASDTAPSPSAARPKPATASSAVTDTDQSATSSDPIKKSATSTDKSGRATSADPARSSTGTSASSKSPSSKSPSSKEHRASAGAHKTHDAGSNNTHRHDH